MSKATEKQIAFILDLIEKAKTTQGRVAAARNNLTGAIMDSKVRDSIDNQLEGHLNVYNEALSSVEWKIINVRNQEGISLDSATASKIIEMLKHPMLRNVSAITYNSKMQMIVQEMTHQQLLDENATNIWVHFSEQTAKLLIPTEPLSG